MLLAFTLQVTEGVPCLGVRMDKGRDFGSLRPRVTLPQLLQPISSLPHTKPIVISSDLAHKTQAWYIERYWKRQGEIFLRHHLLGF